MSEIPNSSENQLKKFLQEWWVLVTTISTSLAGLLTGLISDGIAKIIGFVLSLLTIGIAAFIWVKQDKKKKAKKVSEDRIQGYKTSTETSSFRGLYSFKEGDSLPGLDRQRQVKLIYTQIIDPNFTFGLICGESGCGKSSILHAGIIQLLKARGKKVVIFENNKNTSTKNNLSQYLNKIKNNITVTDTQEKEFLIIDQFEEFFITWLEFEERQKIGQFLHELLRNNVKIVLVLRKDFLADINDFEPAFPNPISSKNIFYIKNFTTSEAKEIIEICAKGDGLTPSEELTEVLVRDLTSDGYVRPVQLQIVCTALLANFDINNYRINGGAIGILSSYVKDVINLCSNPDLAKKILRTLCDFSARAKTEPKTIFSINKELDDNIDETTIENLLTQLETSRIIIFILEHEFKKARIIHDYLVESINIATSALATNHERANHLIKYYIQNNQIDDKINITSKDINFIKANADKILIADPRYKKLVKKNRIKKVYRVVSFALLIIFLTSFFVALLTKKSYWKDEIVDFHLDENKSPVYTTIYANPDEKFVITGTFIGKPYTYMWDIETGKKLYTMKGDEYVNFNNLILSWNETDSFSYLHNLLKREKKKLPIRLGRFGNIEKIIGSDANTNIIAYQSILTDSVSLWSVTENKKIVSFQCFIGSGIQNIEFDPSLTKVFVTCKKNKTDRENNVIGIWDIANGNFIKFLSTEDSANAHYFIISEKVNKVFTIESSKNNTYKMISWDLLTLNKIKEVIIKNSGWLRLTKNEKYIVQSDISSDWISQEKPLILNTGNLTSFNEIANANLNLLADEYFIFNKLDSNKTYISNIDNGNTYAIDYNLSHFAQEPIIKNDSILIIFNKDKSVQIWNYKRNSKKILDKIPDVMGISLTLDSMLQIKQLGNKISIIDLSTNKMIAQLPTIGTDDFEIYYNARCNFFVVWTGDGRVLKFIKTMTIIGMEFQLTNCKN